MADVHKDERKGRCHTTYTIRTWITRSTDQGKLEIVKQEIEHLVIAVLGVSELKWTEVGHFKSGSYKVFHSGNNKLRKKVALILRQDIAQAVRGYHARSDF